MQLAGVAALSCEVEKSVADDDCTLSGEGP
jgi:hypothetical protein